MGDADDEVTEVDVEDDDPGVRAYPWNPWSPVVALTVLLTGVAEALTLALRSLYQDCAAAWNFREGQRRFVSKASRDIETITEVDER